MNALSTVEKRILNFLEESEKGMTTEALAQGLHYRGTKMYKKLVRALNFLTNVGELEQTPQGKYQRKRGRAQYIVGTYRANAQGYGFVTCPEETADFFVPPGRSLDAMQGDQVEVEVLKYANPQTGKGSEVQVRRVLERAVTQLVGEFTAYPSDDRQRHQLLGYVKPQGDYSEEVRIEIEAGGIQPADHSICIVKISQYPTPEAPHRLRGYVAKEIGHRDEPGVDILSVLYQFGIPHEFPPAVKEAAQAVPQNLSSEDLRGREDLRDRTIFTIDGADAKDLDDAISLEVTEKGDFLLGVHIADVSHYVQEGSPLDLEAYQRGTSVYLTDRVVPMLPQRLSNGICSLHPHEDRLTLSCEMVIDQQGTVKHHRIFPSIIHSAYRMTYDEVNEILEGKEETRQGYPALVPILEEMGRLHAILETRRVQRGALDFDAPEAKVVVDEEGHPLAIDLRERGVAERLIESFMLAANETVAKTYMLRDYPMIYRVHEQPNEERMQRFAEFMTSFGIVLRGHVASIAPKQLQSALQQVEGEDYESSVSTMMLRSMKQARYSEEPLGHYGLATAEYTHFTSPIRRYPDLVVHRLIHQYLEAVPNKSQEARLHDQLPAIADQSSKMERRAIEAERDVMAMKKAEFMLDKIGQEFEAKVSSVTSFGIFVALDNTVEGLISLRNLTGDYYEFDPQHMLLLGQRTGNIFRIGQKVKVRLDAVNVGEREIDFSLLEAEEVTGSEIDWIRQQTGRKKVKVQHPSSGKSKAKSEQTKGKSNSTKKSQKSRKNQKGQNKSAKAGKEKSAYGKRQNQGTPTKTATKPFKIKRKQPSHNRQNAR